MHDGRKSLEFCARHGLAITNTMLKHKMCIVYMAMIDFAVVSSDKSRPVIWSLPSELNQRAGRLLDEAEAEESSDSIKGPKGRQQRRSQKRTFGSPVLGSSPWTQEGKPGLGSSCAQPEGRTGDPDLGYCLAVEKGLWWSEAKLPV